MIGKALEIPFLCCALPRAELDRPAGAGRVMVPVMMPHTEHLERRAYRPDPVDVKPAGVDAFEFAVRLSLMPWGVPSGAIQMLCASP